MKTAMAVCVVAAILVSGCDYGSSLRDEDSGIQSDAAARDVLAEKNGSNSGSREVVTFDELAASLSDLLEKPTSWLFYNDNTEAVEVLGSIVPGPSPTPSGLGSVVISAKNTERPNLATYRFSGTPLASITALAFSTYNPSAGNGGAANRAAYLQFNVDFNGSDTWQRRLVYVPRNNGTVVQNQWQEWDAIQGGAAKWSLSGGTWPGTATPGSTLKTWNQILTDYPGVRIRVSDSFLGLRVGEPYPNGYTEYIDKFVFGTTAGTTTFDFEPAKETCMKGGWQQSADPAFPNQGACIQYNNTSK